MEPLHPSFDLLINCLNDASHAQWWQRLDTYVCTVLEHNEFWTFRLNAYTVYLVKTYHE